MLSSTFLLTLLPLALSAPSRPIDKRDTAPIYDGSQVSGKTYDYVIAGGGLTGVVLAARLSEDSSKSVLVVESGYNEENNRDVTGEYSLLPSIILTIQMLLDIKALSM